MTTAHSSPGAAGVVFDLDGVITATASLHFRAWGTLVDEVLGSDAAPLSEEEYQRVLDGRERVTALADLLDRRGCRVPLGSPSDPPGHRSTHGFAARKQELYLALLDSEGVHVYPDAERALERLSGSVPLAVVSASRNLARILRATGLGHYFDVRVDGNTAAELALPGKPAPDTYRYAAELLGLPPPSLAMFEDAEAGVVAGRAAGYGLVIGVARDDARADRLLAKGADLVVSDLDEIGRGPMPLAVRGDITAS